MANQTKGYCKYCGKEYTKSYMTRHLAGCSKREAGSVSKTTTQKQGYYELVISGKYDKAYWLIIEISENATLNALDKFLRDIWLECCGHLSKFEIKGISYDSDPVKELVWGPPSKDMNHKLKTVLQKGMVIAYSYDFGSTTELVITVQEYREYHGKRDQMTILSRNNPPEFICAECGEEPAVEICMECVWEGRGFLCEQCAETHSCNEDLRLNVSNSPRSGTCGYMGSEIYPDQFVPDK